MYYIVKFFKMLPQFVIWQSCSFGGGNKSIFNVGYYSKIFSVFILSSLTLIAKDY
jgi:hypothetical protein